ncbi:uncharacterized protein TNCV_3938341 [Trichonephila clavipes]|nr:uncharacterized protein TNCV_3938341 [Trichonephila clavipes]
MVITSEGAVEYVMVGVSRRPTQAIWRGKEIEPVQVIVMSFDPVKIVVAPELRQLEFNGIEINGFICKTSKKENRGENVSTNVNFSNMMNCPTFQQDGAACHTARATFDLLKDTFGDRVISCFGSVNRPPRSCDLTPLDYFLWGYVKSLVYADKPQTLDHLEDNIRRVIADIRPQMLEKVIENWTSRLDYIRVSRGSPMPEIKFKM